MDVNGIWTLSGAEKYLNSSSSEENVIDRIKEIIYSWTYKSEYDLQAIRDDLTEIAETAKLEYFTKQTDTEVDRSIGCIVYSELYENLVPLIRGKFSKEDLYLYEKCTYLCKNNVSPGHLGSSVYNSLPFIAAKKECEIPVINNDEVIPILMLVVIKSKLLYLWSNLFYIKFFGEQLFEGNDHVRSILEAYETVVQKILTINESSLKLNCDKATTDLDMSETMAILSSTEELETKTPLTIKDEGKKRLISLIISSTAERNFIPVDVAKIFS
ncbi:hypothetical protein NQ315_005136 [Exocentrus adspersus]|uniref:Uncharacterized protein n=1 Tax=Exocentrus adspersus TaxID=1586481 RepID=A0AAV8VU52_9CUCU|nr:hypothetical protein NQ315_005136 [Exocentrus adspersus]